MAVTRYCIEPDSVQDVMSISPQHVSCVGVGVGVVETMSSSWCCWQPAQGDPHTSHWTLSQKDPETLPLSPSPT